MKELCSPSHREEEEIVSKENQPAIIKETQITNTNSPLIEMNEGNDFMWADNWLLYFDKDNSVYVKLANFAINPICKIMHLFKNKQPKNIIEFSVNIEGSIRGPMSIAYSGIDNLFTTIRSCYPEVYTNPEATKVSQRLSTYFSQQIKNLPIKYCYHNVGWENIEGRYQYLHDGKQEIANVSCETGKCLMVARNITAADAFRKVLGLLSIAEDKTKIVVPFLFSHLGVMYSIFELAGHAPKFLLFLNGTTGSFKTALSKVLFNIFNSDNDIITANFKDTITAIEIKMGETSDSVLLLDDYHPGSSKSEQIAMKNKLETIIRFYGDGISKSRSTVTLEKQIEYKPTGVCAITGEDTAGSLSSLYRCILIDVALGTYDGKKLEEYQKNPLILSTHMGYFINFLERNFDQIRAMIETSFLDLREEYSHLCKAKRLVDTTVHLVLTVKIFVLYTLNMGFVTQENCRIVETNWINSIVTAVNNSEKLSETTAPAIMYLQAIESLIENKKVAIAENSQQYCNDIASFMGYVEKGYLVLKHNDTYAAVVSFWRRLQKTYTLSMGKTHTELFNLNLTKAEKGGHLYKTLSCIPGRPRMLALDQDRMHQVLHEQ